MRTLVLTLAILGAASCSQDPMASYPDYIRNATPPDKQVVEKRPAVPQEALVIEMNPGIANFLEGKEGMVTFSGRVAGAENGFDLEIADLPPGASFDSSTGVLTWTPPKYYIQGNEYHVTTSVKVRLFTHLEPVMVHEEEFGLTVYRDFFKPEITLVTLDSDYREGESKLFEVTVKDPDSSSSGDQSYMPALHILSSQNAGSDGAPYIEIIPNKGYTPNPSRNPNDPSEWTYRLQVNLREREVTSDQQQLEFGLKATSSFGVPSMASHLTFKVHTRVSAPVIAMHEKEFEVAEGERFRLHFNVYTAKGDGEVNVGFEPSCDKLPGKANCSCSPAPGRTDLQLCQIDWLPIKPDRSLYHLRIRAENAVGKGPSSQRKSSMTEVKFKLAKPVSIGSQ